MMPLPSPLHCNQSDAFQLCYSCSFSPYSPTASVYAARMEGLCTAGIIDHDSISGAEEFLEAAKLHGMEAS